MTSAASSVPIPDPPELKIKGHTVNEVFNSMYDCVKREIDEINNAEDRIAHALRDIAGKVRTNWESFVSARPALADATASTVTSPTYLGYST